MQRVYPLSVPRSRSQRQRYPRTGQRGKREGGREGTHPSSSSFSSLPNADSIAAEQTRGKPWRRSGPTRKGSMNIFCHAREVPSEKNESCMEINSIPVARLRFAIISAHHGWLARARARPIARRAARARSLARPRPLTAVPRESRLSNHSNFQLLAAAEAEAALTECRPAAASDAIVVVVEWNGRGEGRRRSLIDFFLHFKSRPVFLRVLLTLSRLAAGDVHSRARKYILGILAP